MEAITRQPCVPTVIGLAHTPLFLDEEVWYLPLQSDLVVQRAPQFQGTLLV